MNKEAAEVWSRCAKLIEDHVEPAVFRSVFLPIEAVDFKDDTLTILVASDYIRQTIENNHFDILRKALLDVIGENCKLNYKVVLDNSKPEDKITMTTTSTLTNVTTDTPLVKMGGIKNPFIQPVDFTPIDPRLNSDYTMDSFIEGECNRLAKSAGKAIASKPGRTAFNPFLIYGGSGLGKTHLANAVGLEVKRLNPSAVVLYVSAHEFQTQFVEAKLRNEINDFMHFYYLVDVLIIDDIHEFADKPGTQKTFFHIFNFLHQSGKQIIMTCDKAPSDLNGMEERLLTRFKWGLSAEIKSPDFETRKQIFQNKSQRDGIEMRDDVVNYVCKNVCGNVRELEGAISSLLAQSLFIKKDLTLDVVRDLIGSTTKVQKEELSIDRIKEVVCDYFRISEDSLQKSSRERALVQARQLAMYFAKVYTNSSLSQIGAKVGKKNHATVLYSCKAVEDLLVTDREFKSNADEIRHLLGY